MPVAVSPDEVVVPVRKPLPLYNVIVHNCSCHTFEDVIVGLVRILRMDVSEATRKAIEIDRYGQGVVAQTNLEAAELYASRLRNEVISASNTRLGTSIQPAA